MPRTLINAGTGAPAGSNPNPGRRLRDLGRRLSVGAFVGTLAVGALAVVAPTAAGALTAQTITITSTAPASPAVNSTYQATATATSGLPVTFTSATPLTCFVDATNLVSFNGLGACTIVADQAGNGIYSAAPEVSQVQNPITACNDIDTLTADGAAAIYPMNDASGTSVADVSGNGNTGTIPGSVTYDNLPGPLACNTDLGAMGFSGSSGSTTSYVNTNVAAGSAAVTGSALTVVAWVNAANWNNDPRIVEDGHTDTDHQGFELLATGGSGGYFAVGNGTADGQATWNQPLSTGTWYMVAGTYDGSTSRVYIDGATAGSAPVAGGGAVATGDNPVSIGYGRSATCCGFDGQIADVAILSSALSANQIRALYLNESSSGTNAIVAPPTCGVLTSYTLPATASSISVDLGGAGGGGGAGGLTGITGTVGGVGGVASSGNLAVDPSTDPYLNYEVGCGGGGGTAAERALTTAGGAAGAGWGAGGAGGAAGNGNASLVASSGGGGGGGSIACLSTSPSGCATASSVPIVVAGGGAGGGANGCTVSSGSGGAGQAGSVSGAEQWYSTSGASFAGLGYGGAGGAAGSGGSGGGGGGGTGTNGGGGSAGSGGSGGGNNTAGGGGAGATTGSTGATGSVTAGGAGGAGASGTQAGDDDQGGGGGGGGYQGGGGGGSDFCPTDGGAGGGGAGSSWGNSSVGATLVLSGGVGGGGGAAGAAVSGGGAGSVGGPGSPGTITLLVTTSQTASDNVIPSAVCGSSLQSQLLPVGTTSASLTLTGAGGGGAGSGPTGDAGGAGAAASYRNFPTDGATYLDYEVGCGGTGGGAATSAATGDGWGNGGAGGASSSSDRTGGTGGGGSMACLSSSATSCTTPLLVAGGGGGGGSRSNASYGGGAAGAGGAGSVSGGAEDWYGTGGAGFGFGGGGGSQGYYGSGGGGGGGTGAGGSSGVVGSGGSGGANNTGGGGGATYTHGATGAAGSGSSTSGGSGGAGGSSGGEPSGGGGGGGYYGGGGGGYDSSGNDAGSGGGGSSWGTTGSSGSLSFAGGGGASGGVGGSSANGAAGANGTIQLSVAGSFGPPSQLAFTAPPTNTIAGSTINLAGGVQVAVEDAADNVITSGPGSADSVTVAIGTNPSAGTLSGTLTEPVINGVATFSDLAIDLVGTGYTLVATDNTAPDTGLTGTSGTFDITPVPTTLLITSPAVSGVTGSGNTLGPITVVDEGAGSAPAPAGPGGTVLSLSSSSAGGTFAATSGGSSGPSVTIPAGSSTVSFFYGDTTAGSPTVTVAAVAQSSATQVETLTNTVSVTDPGDQSSTSGTAIVALPVVAVDSSSTATISNWVASGLPTGLSIDASSGAITGTPTTAGSFVVSVTATDSASFTGSTSFTWTIGNTVAITDPGAQSAVSGTAITASTIAAVDSSPVATLSFAATGLPTGLSIDASSGAITGTPTTAGSFSVDVTVTDSADFTGSATFTWSITNSVSVTDPGAQSGVSGTAITALAPAAVDSSPVATISGWAATGLPAGLSIDATSGAITGTPTTAGSFSVTVTATDSAAFTGSATFTWTITNVVSVTNPGPQSDVSGTAITALAIVAVDSSSVATLSYAATGLPAGLSIDASSGAITGTPTTPVAAAPVTVTVTDSAAFTGSATFTWTITAPITTDDPYIAVTPVRICDTRAGNPSALTGTASQCNGSDNAGKTLAANVPLTISVAGDFGLPADASAVVLNVTAVDPDTAGYVSVYPAGQPVALVSNLNATPGNSTPNLVEAGIGTSGQVSLISNVDVDVVVDLEGYVAPMTTSGAGLYNPLSAPARICDTRAGNPSGLAAPDNQCNGAANAGDPVVAGTVSNVQVTGDGGVPASGVSAVVLNVTVAEPAAKGYLTVFPEGALTPTASNLNYLTGQTVANRVIVPVSATGMVSLIANQNTDAIVDVSGWFSGPGGSGTQFTPLAAPVRVCDTRVGNPSGLSGVDTQCNGVANAGMTLSAGSTITVNVANIAGVPTGAKAVVFNLTAIKPTTQTHLTVYPGPTLPDVSDLNPAAGATRANLVVATVSATGTVTISNYAGTVDLAVDLSGYYE